jgi:hypothetical protein
VEARDNDGKGNVNSAELVLHVTDVNDAPPSFDKLVPVVMSEDESVGTLVARLSASDPDLTADLRYSLDVNASEAFTDGDVPVQRKKYDFAQLFRVDEQTGDVLLAAPLDRESAETIKLAVVVRDAKAPGPESQMDTAVLTIFVRDVNDNKPKFVNVLTTASASLAEYTASVLENSPKGTKIVTVTATDADKNKTIHYSLESGDSSSPLLEVDSDSGDVRVSDGRIDRETHEWINLTVRATDSGFPPLFSLAHVHLRVVDLNDNMPVFETAMLNATGQKTFIYVTYTVWYTVRFLLNDHW